jgi:hypothetical protein
MSTNNPQLNAQVQKLVGIHALRIIAKLVSAQKLEDEENSFLIKRVLIAFACFVAYPIPAFALFKLTFGKYMDRSSPMYNKYIFLAYLLSWLVVLLIPLLWPRNDRK